MEGQSLADLSRTVALIRNIGEDIPDDIQVEVWGQQLFVFYEGEGFESLVGGVDNPPGPKGVRACIACMPADSDIGGIVRFVWNQIAAVRKKLS